MTARPSHKRWKGQTQVTHYISYSCLLSQQGTRTGVGALIQGTTRRNKRQNAEKVKTLRVSIRIFHELINTIFVLKESLLYWFNILLTETIFISFYSIIMQYIIKCRNMEFKNVQLLGTFLITFTIVLII